MRVVYRQSIPPEKILNGLCRRNTGFEEEIEIWLSAATIRAQLVQPGTPIDQLDKKK